MPRNIEMKKRAERDGKVLSDASLSDTYTDTGRVEEIRKRRRTSRLYGLAMRVVNKLGVQDRVRGFLNKLAKIRNEIYGRDAEIQTVHMRQSTYFHRTDYRLRRAIKLTHMTAVAFFKLIVPLILPYIAAAAVIVFVILAFNFSVALEVNVNGEKIGVYVKNQKDFNSVKNSVASLISEKYNGEYCVDVYPTVELAIINRNEITDKDEAVEQLYTVSSAELGKSYGIYIDGVLIGSLMRETETESLLDGILSYYLDGIEGGEYDVVNSIEIIKGSYSSDLEMTYDEMLALFTKPEISLSHYIERGETAESIAESFGISIPVLKLLNSDIDFSSLHIGQRLEVGAPKHSLSVLVIQTVTTTEVIPFQTVYTKSDELYQGFSEVRQAGVFGSYDVEYRIKYVNGIETSRTETSRIKLSDAVSQLVVEGTKEIASTGFLIWPVDKSVRSYISSPFGNRMIYGRWKFHNATDIAAPYKTPIYAADGGTVVKMGWDNGGLGNYVMIDHGNGYVTTYGHCSSISKKLHIGMTVYQGYVIAYIGMTGTATGYHVHFSLYSKAKGNYIDNARYINHKISYLK